MNPAGEVATAVVDDALHIQAVEKGLSKNVLSGVASLMTALASVGPALVLATVVGIVTTAAGVHAVGVLLLAAVPMLMVARSFWEFDLAERDCGTSFVWVGRALGPTAGFMAGWGQLGAGVIIVPASVYTIAQYTFSLFRLDELGSSTGWTIALGLAFIVGLGWVCYLGVETAAMVQRILVILEVLLVAVLLVVAIVNISNGEVLAGAAAPSFDWLNPFGAGSGVTDALVVAIFAYWGWDIAFSLSEESRGATTPGRAAVTSILALALVYIIGTTVFLAFAGPAFMGEHASTLLAAIGNSVLGEGLGKVLITLAVLTSAMAATQSTFVAGSRLLLSMGAYKALPQWFARTNRRKAPVATVCLLIVGAALFVLLTLLSTTVLFDSLSSTGVVVCFYYGLTVVACAWRFRSTLRVSFANLLWRGIVPMTAGLILLGVFVKSVFNYADPAHSGVSIFGIGVVFWIAFGYLAIGVVLAVVVRFKAREYMSRRTLRPGFLGAPAAPVAAAVPATEAREHEAGS